MQVEKLNGFVLRAVSLSASRDVVTLFSEERGLVSGVARRQKGGGAAWLAPLTGVSFHLAGKEHQALRSLRDPSLQSHCLALANTWAGLTLLHHLSWLVSNCQAEGQEDSHVFRLLSHCQSYLSHNPEPACFPAVTVYFETWLLHFCGVLPRLPAAQLPQPYGEDAQLQQALDTVSNRAIFQVKIEDWVADALQLGSLTGTLVVLGNMWARFLSKELKTRKLLLAQFDRK